MVIGNLGKAHGNRLKCSAGFDNGIFGALSFEMIPGFSKLAASKFRKFSDGSPGEFRMCIDACSHSRATQRKLAQVVAQFLEPVHSELYLTCIAAKFLPQTNRG